MTQDITSLIEKLEGADPKDAWVFAPDVHLALFGGSLTKAARCPKYTTSLDAALALAERVMSEDEALFWLNQVVYRADQDTVNGTIRGLPLKLCAALLRAQSEAR